ncbi:MAG: BlaI/MecI/CopY family transcriptional regulator [Chloroflexi bacterium]|nr:BlaI/MecI/CopY family transcriptional regulator [Chloroflexota bacterium]
MTGKSTDVVQKLLGDLEYAVMQVIWEHQRVTVRDVADILNQRRPLAYTTVMTVMSRLADKGILRQHRVGRAYEYEAAFTPQELAAEAAGQTIRSLLEDFGPLAVTQFVQQVEQIDRRQLERLAQLAQEAREPDAN